MTATLLSAVVLLPAAALSAADPLQPKQWGLVQARAPQAWAAARGKGIVIAVIDSGIDLGHEDLVGKLVAGRDFVDGDATPQDGDGHGTHVAGIAAAATGNGKGVAGVAPAARIMPVRVLGDDGTGSAGDVADGIRWAVDHGAHVINLSLGDLGQPLFGPAFGNALRYAWARGAIPVVAAGNEYLLSSGYADEPAIVVSATDRSDRKPSYSSGVGAASWGMAAPGGAGALLGGEEENVLSTHPGGYAYMAGTSMAAPHVSGAAAILRSLGLSASQTVDRLLATAKDLGSPGRDATFGAGRLDVAAAVDGVAAGSAKGKAKRTGPVSGTGPSGAGSTTPGSTPQEAAPRSEPAPSPEEAPPASAGEGTGAGRDLPGGSDEGFPLAAWVTGLVTILLAIAIGWTLFRPNPPE